MIKYLGLLSMLGAGLTFSKLFLLADGYSLKHQTISKLVLHEKISKKAQNYIVLWASLRLVYFMYLIQYFNIRSTSFIVYVVGVIVVISALITALVPVSKNLLVHRISAFTALVSIVLFSVFLNFGILNYANAWQKDLAHTISILLIAFPLYFGFIKKSLGFLELSVGILFVIWDIFLLIFFF